MQGLTLKRANIDIGKVIFSGGHAYVALSRVATLNGLKILDIDKSKLYQRKTLNKFGQNEEITN